MRGRPPFGDEVRTGRSSLRINQISSRRIGSAKMPEQENDHPPLTNPGAVGVHGAGDVTPRQAPTSFFKVAITASPLNGLTIHPLIPAALPRSFITGEFSVVSMMMLTL